MATYKTKISLHVVHRNDALFAVGTDIYYKIHSLKSIQIRFREISSVLCFQHYFRFLRLLIRLFLIGKEKYGDFMGKIAQLVDLYGNGGNWNKQYCLYKYFKCIIRGFHLCVNFQLLFNSLKWTLKWRLMVFSSEWDKCGWIVQKSSADVLSIARCNVDFISNCSTLIA